MYLDEMHRRSIQRNVSHALGLTGAATDLVMRAAELLLAAHENQIVQKVSAEMCACACACVGVLV